LAKDNPGESEKGWRSARGLSRAEIISLTQDIPGDPMEVLVLGVEEGGRRIRLFRKGVTRGREEETMREYGSTQAQGGGSLGTLGDLLRDKLEKK